MRNINRLILLISLSSVTMAQLPFFLQRFRPVKHGLLSSGSTSYPSFASTLFPLSSSSSLLSPTYGPHSSFLSSSSLSSLPFSTSGLSSLSLSSPFSTSASTLSPHFGSSLLSSSSLGSSLFSPSNYGSPNFASNHLSSPNFASNHLSSPSFASSHLSSPSFASSHLSSPSFTSSHLSSPHKLSASSLSHAFDLGTVGNFDGGLGGFDQAELLDDYQGFSHAGFGKDLNFAGSQAVKFHAHPQAPYNGEPLVYLQRSTEK